LVKGRGEEDGWGRYEGGGGRKGGRGGWGRSKRCWEGGWRGEWREGVK